MMRDNDDLQKPMPQPNARTYHSPKLFVYGAIRDMTGDGRSGDPENKGKDIQPFKRA